MTKNNVFDIKDCYGCGLCETVCRHKVIDVRLNRNGFYEPHIVNPDACTQCGLCAKVCSFCNDGLAAEYKPIKSYAVWSNNEDVRKECSSGGAGLEIAHLLMAQGYKLCGVRYNVEKQRAEHYIAETIEETLASTGSKYIPSFTVEAFKEIDLKQKYLVTGTPCQIDSFRRYIKMFRCEDNFVLLDFFCHSVPSMNAWKFYSNEMQKQIGDMQQVKWRCKDTGWHDSFNMSAINGSKRYSSRMSKGDLFYTLFLGDYCSGPACSSNCKFKYDRCSADIRIGDFWGKTYAGDDKGVSSVVAFTEKGRKIIESLTSCSIETHPFEVAAEGQMKRNIRHKPVRPLIMSLLRGKPSKQTLLAIVMFQKGMDKIKRLMKR